MSHQDSFIRFSLFVMPGLCPNLADYVLLGFVDGGAFAPEMPTHRSHPISHRTYYRAYNTRKLKSTAVRVSDPLCPPRVRSRQRSSDIVTSVTHTPTHLPAINCNDFKEFQIAKSLANSTISITHHKRSSQHPRPSSIARAWLISGVPSNYLLSRSRILRSGTWLSSSRLQDGLCGCVFQIWMTREICNQPLMRQIIQSASPSINEQAETEGY